MPYEETEGGNEIFTCSTCGYSIMIQGTGSDIDCPRCIEREYAGEVDGMNHWSGIEIKTAMKQYIEQCSCTDGFKNIKQFLHEIETDSQESDEH